MTVQVIRTVFDTAVAIFSAMSSSRACSGKNFTVEEAAELVVDDFLDESDVAEDFGGLITQEEFFGHCASSADEDADRFTAASSAEGALYSDDDEEEDHADAVAAGGTRKNLSSTTKTTPAAKRLRTNQWLVNSIDAAMDPENFDAMEFPATKKPKPCIKRH